MEAIQGGDRRAFRVLFERTQARVYASAWNLLGDAGAAEEIVVEAYLQIWQRAPDFDPSRGSVRAWIDTIARRRTIDRLRARELRRFLRKDSDLREIHARGPDPAEASQTREDSLRLRAELERLPFEERRCLEEAFVNGLSHAEIARASGQPLGTVKTRIRTALRHLKTRLSPRSFGRDSA